MPGGRPRKPTTTPSASLVTQGGLPVGADGRRVQEVSETTLTHAATLIETWAGLEPIVKQLIAQVRTSIEAGEIDAKEAPNLLAVCGRVVQQVGAAATAVMRASEGQQRLALLMDGTRERSAPAQMTEKQLVGVVLEVAQRLKRESGVCPVCTAKPIDVTPAPERPVEH